MLKNYFIVAWRNILRNKIFSVIKISGLSLGLTVCMLIVLYTKNEITYDRFHEKKDNIYRITQEMQMGREESQKTGITNAIVGETFRDEIPEMAEVVRINGMPVTIKSGNDIYTDNPLFVDSTFFSVFSFPLIRGNANTVLNDINSMVLSKDAAKKYFGTTDAVGKILEVKMRDDFESFTVSGVAENSPENSTIKFEMLLPFSYYKKFNEHDTWLGGSLNTFVLLSPHANVKAVERKMGQIFDKNTKDQIAKALQEQGLTIKAKLSLQPLSDIHLNPALGGVNGLDDSVSPTYSYILGVIAAFVLIIACINFINLAVAQSLKRSKEIGIRKVVGGDRRQLIVQFLTESFVVTLVAFVIAVALTAIVLPFFNELANKKLGLSYLADARLYGTFFLLLLITAFIAGFYPSLVLSGFQPLKVLYSRQKLMGKNYLTRGLIVFQFALAIFLIIAAVAVYAQLNFMFHKDLGYDSKNLVRINLPFSKTSDKLPKIFKSELANQSSIVSIAARNNGRSITAVRINGKQVVTDVSKIDEAFFPTFKILILAGRNFSPNYPSDLNSSVIVTETFVKEAGWKNNNAIGQTVHSMDNKIIYTVVGVIKDYHFSSLKEKITPQIFVMDSTMNYGQVWVKVRPDNIPKTLSLLQATFKKVLPFFPYDYQFMDSINARNYEAETKWKQIISIASGLFIFISCIGLFGLVLLSIEQRTKEIGIRKVLGAAVAKIVVLISKDFVLLIAIAFVVAAPLAYHAVNKWLQDFAYRINIAWWMFATAGLLVLVFALVTMGYQAIKAAVANPVNSLRTE
jgi:ABC-type antimicrobial peptide transport system permease subunit